MKESETILCHCDRLITLSAGEDSRLCDCGERVFSTKIIRDKIGLLAKKQAATMEAIERLQRKVLSIGAEIGSLQLELTLRERYRTGTDVRGRPIDRNPDTFWQGVWGRPRKFRDSGQEKPERLVSRRELLQKLADLEL